MKSLAFVPALMLSAGLFACSSAPKSPAVSDAIRKSLDDAGLKNVSVSQDREKGVVTLGGSVAGDADKAQAESLGRSLAAGQVVADEIAVIPPDAPNVKKIHADLDKAIEENLDAALIAHSLGKGVSYGVKNGVVRLTGDVNSETRRAQVETIASRVPNVQQVVNELQIRDQKATSSN